MTERPSRRLDSGKLRYTLRQEGDAHGVEVWRNPGEGKHEFKLVTREHDRFTPNPVERVIQMSRKQAFALMRILGRSFAREDEL